jgi:protein TonB
MRRIRLSALVVLGLSVSIHGIGIGIAGYPAQQPVSLASAPSVALLGDSFEDLAAGGIEAVSPPDVTEPADQSEVAPVTEITDAAPTPNAAIADVTPTATSALPVAPQVAQSAAPVIASASAPANVVQALDEPVVQQADANTVRPVQRPSNLGQTPPPRQQAAQQQPRRQPTPQRSQQQTTRQPQSAGNSDQNARRGSDNGSTSGQSAQGNSGTNAQAQGQSNSRAVSRYPGQVQRRLSRTRRARINVRGEARVTFSIAPSGALASVSISRSSGNAELDAAALDHVRRAAPFPAPPAGAQRRYTVPFAGR